MSSAEEFSRTADAIECEIEVTRESLARKLEEIQRRVDPRERLHRVRQRINREDVAAWSAVSAIVAGAGLAVAGWQRHRAARGDGADSCATFLGAGI